MMDIKTLRETFVCDPVEGTLIWNHRPREHFKNAQVWKAWNKKHAYKKAGSFDGEGYRRVGLLRSHHIIWAFATEAWPVAEIDHRNGKKDDNRIANLREAPDGRNQHNRARSKNSTSGFMGVSAHKKTGKWKAYINLNWRQIHLGIFDTAEEAHAAYLAAKAVYHPFQPTLRQP